jgi:hypothetical protein
VFSPADIGRQEKQPAWSAAPICSAAGSLVVIGRRGSIPRGIFIFDIFTILPLTFIFQMYYIYYHALFAKRRAGYRNTGFVGFIQKKGIV